MLAETLQEWLPVIPDIRRSGLHLSDAGHVVRWIQLSNLQSGAFNSRRDGDCHILKFESSSSRAASYCARDLKSFSQLTECDVDHHYIHWHWCRCVFFQL